ncbi:hypothetical protein LBMAG53_17170 [Planctomycetota bacterium]|nr:hypothetical protein LBMAG53_17170 [Planctomycetota bacterium]
MVLTTAQRAIQVLDALSRGSAANSYPRPGVQRSADQPDDPAFTSVPEASEWPRLLAWLGNPDPGATVQEITSLLVTMGVATPVLPSLAWPLIEAVRRCPDHRSVPTTTLAHLGAVLDRWEAQQGQLDAVTPAGILAQALLVQDLHCLADLCSNAGQGWASGPWSRRGHRLEQALHVRLWHDSGYVDTAGPADPLAMLLLLDTPAERIAILAKQALKRCQSALARNQIGSVFLAWEGAHRHRLTDQARQIAELVR